MKCTLSIVVVLASMAYGHVLPLVSYGPATYVQPAPQYNTAVVQSDQVGGSFAYSVSEGQAFQEISPVISTEIHPVYGYQWTGGYPAPGPNLIFPYPVYGSVIPSVPFLPGAIPAPPPPSAEEPSPDDDSTGIETVTDEADNQPDDAEPIKQSSSADNNANDDSVSVDSA